MKYLKKHPCGVLPAVFYAGGAARPCCCDLSQMPSDRLKSSASGGPVEAPFVGWSQCVTAR